MFAIKKSPLTADSMLPYQDSYACGQLAIELAQYKNGQPMPFKGPVKVASSILSSINFESILPYDLMLSLEAVGIKAEEEWLSGSNTIQINLLRSKLLDKKLPILYVGVGAGHWITIWGFDTVTQEFLIFDSSKEAISTRQRSGLSRYAFDKVIYLSQRQVVPQRICNLTGRIWPRFLAKPSTVIFA